MGYGKLTEQGERWCPPSEGELPSERLGVGCSCWEEWIIFHLEGLVRLSWLKTGRDLKKSPSVMADTGVWYVRYVWAIRTLSQSTYGTPKHHELEVTIAVSVA